MTSTLGLALAALLAAGPTSQPVRSQPDTTSAHLATDIRIAVWTDSGAPYLSGETAHVYLRSAQRSYVSIVRVDTEGRPEMLLPSAPGQATLVPDTAVYSLGDGAFVVDDRPGVGYLLALVSSRPFDFEAIAAEGRWHEPLLDGSMAVADPAGFAESLVRRIAPEGGAAYDLAPYQVAPAAATLAVQDTTRPRRDGTRRAAPPPRPDRTTGATEEPRRAGGRTPEGVTPARGNDRPKGQPRSTGEPVLKRRKP
jgi:hypothetical protein